MSYEPPKDISAKANAERKASLLAEARALGVPEKLLHNNPMVNIQREVADARQQRRQEQQAPLPPKPEIKPPPPKLEMKPPPPLLTPRDPPRGELPQLPAPPQVNARLIKDAIAEFTKDVLEDVSKRPTAAAPAPPPPVPEPTDQRTDPRPPAPQIPPRQYPGITPDTACPVPCPPTTGNYVLTSQDGVMSWEAIEDC